jgi:hypothetical protein
MKYENKDSLNTNNIYENKDSLNTNNSLDNHDTDTTINLTDSIQINYNKSRDYLWCPDVGYPGTAEDWSKYLKKFTRSTDGLLNKLTSKKNFVNEVIDLPVVSDIIEGLELTGNNVKLMPNRIEFNKWLYNLVLLFIYNKCLDVHSKAVLHHNVEVIDDLLNDLKSTMNRVETLFDVSIKRRITKKGVIIQQNVYAGFDTEFELADSSKHLNELLSAQIAVNTRLIVKVPIVEPFKIEYVNPLTSEVDELTKKVNRFLIDCIDREIKTARFVKFNKYDEALSQFASTLKELRIGLESFVHGDKEILVFSLSKTSTKIEMGSYYTLKKLLEDIDALISNDLVDNLLSLEALITDTSFGDLSKCFTKSNSRTSFTTNSYKVYATTRLNLIIGCHLSQADLSMLSDFEDFKKYLTIINKSYVTLNKSFKYEDSRFNISVRDTMLLSPSGKGLADIGRIYGGEFSKIDLGEYRGRMKDLLKDNKELFVEYALRDSLITLKHLNEMEKFYMSFDQLGVPLTLSSISKAYVKKDWALREYKGYQLNNGYTFGKLTSLLTPKGINASEDVGLILGLALSSLRGGRNESFMYGVDRWKLKDSEGKGWYDYDLSGAYPTAMAILGDPSYKNAFVVTKKWMDEASPCDLINSYTVVRVSFSFPEETKYPSIPTQIDGNTIYPLSGVSNITGLEYLLARNQNCEFEVIDGYSIPFECMIAEGFGQNKASSLSRIESFRECFRNQNHFDESFMKLFSDNSKRYSPFAQTVKDLVILRAAHKKGTLLNLMYKQIVNSIYGLTVMGLSSKKKTDLISGGSFVLEGGDLSNPFIGGYITAFIRCVLSECLNNIHHLNGRVVSATTDGFITDQIDVEDLILKNRDFNSTLFLRLFKSLRSFVVDKKEEIVPGLELKNFEGYNQEEGENKIDMDSERGLISWTTRGQLAFVSGIKAHTGFQSKGLKQSDHKEVLFQMLSSDSVSWEYIQNSLRSAKDIYQKGGHVTLEYKDQSFKVAYDNKRCIIEPSEDKYSFTDRLLDSKPWDSGKTYDKIRKLINIQSKATYNILTTKSSGKRYKSVMETAIRTFIKSLFESGNNSYGVSIDEFPVYNDLVDFINGFAYKGNIKISKSSISHLRHRPTVIRTVPRTKETELFVGYVKSFFPHFDLNNKFLK